MEVNMPNLNKVLNQYMTEVSNLYKRKLISDNKKATGDLIKSIKTSVNFDGVLYTGTIELEDYWKYVEYGSKPHWPPVNAILKWIERKPIIPREVNGIKPTNNQLAYLIGRKISRDGIKPGNQLSSTINELNAKWIPMIEDAIREDINNDIETIIIKR